MHQSRFGCNSELTQNSGSKVCIVIPARKNSLRFPAKVLWKFKGIPMLEHVYQRACLAMSPEHVYITSNDKEILNFAESIGANSIRSYRTHDNGTSRTAEVAQTMRYDFVIILQADEILIDPKHLKSMIKAIKNKRDEYCFNLITKIQNINQLNDTNVVKCVISNNQTIKSLHREISAHALNLKYIYKVMGIIAFERNFLLNLAQLPDQSLQKYLSIEQLKVIECGYNLYGVAVDTSYPSINTIKDVMEVQRYLDGNARQRNILQLYAYK